MNMQIPTFDEAERHGIRDPAKAPVTRRLFDGELGGFVEGAEDLLPRFANARDKLDDDKPRAAKPKTAAKRAVAQPAAKPVKPTPKPKPKPVRRVPLSPPPVSEVEPEVEEAFDEPEEHEESDVPQPGQRSFDEIAASLGMPYLTEEPQRPTVQVTFRSAMGLMSCQYHHVARHDGLLVCKSDPRWPGFQYLPAATADGAPMEVRVPSLNLRCRAHVDETLQFQDGPFDVILLIIEGSSPDEDALEG